MTDRPTQRPTTWLPHLTAGLLAIIYARLISRSPYVASGLQFVAPAAVLLVTHFAWLAGSRRLQAGFSDITVRRTLATAVGVLAVVGVTSIISPMPAQGESKGAAFSDILGLIACLVVIAMVVAFVSFIVFIVVRGSFRLLKKLRPNRSDGDPRYDFGIIGVALSLIGLASLEGVPGAYTFSPADRAAFTTFVRAPPEKVWRAVGKATSPEFALPVMLRTIPQPVAVLVDEGAELGARRIVHFVGREGAGDLTLQVVRRDERQSVFQVVSDTSPIAHWVQQNALTFRVEPSGQGTMLTVTLGYDRKLAPAWFFAPYIRLAAYLAVDVLGRDTASRAERL